MKYELVPQAIKVTVEVISDGEWSPVTQLSVEDASCKITVGLDPDEMDELARALHEAAREARKVVYDA